LGLILASTSPIRRDLLNAAGVAFDVAAPAVDEEAVKAEHIGDGAALALGLAEAKALSVVAPGALVLGSDSTLSVDGVLYSKPRDRAEAAEHLAYFSKRTMLLSSAAALVCDGIVEWSMVDRATLYVRALSRDFIDAYLDAEWPDVAYCVGVFRMEGRGVTLFTHVEGSHFTILGLPLLPLLGALREQGELTS
jgi:septum formation protein